MKKKKVRANKKNCVKQLENWINWMLFWSYNVHDVIAILRMRERERKWKDSHGCGGGWAEKYVFFYSPIRINGIYEVKIHSTTHALVIEPLKFDQSWWNNCASIWFEMCLQ